MQDLCRCMAYGYAKPILTSLFFRADPKKASSGSTGNAPARSGTKTQYMPLSQLRILLYIVFLPCPATARSPPEKGGVVISPPWYTSGNL